jgi:NAD(P)-dependent dehydrogenase (short-subunit alcohol dehydrogenase family)
VSSRQPVAVVTGGGGGIGAAIAMEMGRQGWHVVTVDPMVTVDGAAPTTTAPPEDTTAGRIVAAGGSAQASAASVTDGPALKTLFEQLVSERGGLDAVVNVGGISRPTGFTHGTEDDWRAVISVHLDGYLTVLGAARPGAATYSGLHPVQDGGPRTPVPTAAPSGRSLLSPGNWAEPLLTGSG